MTAILVGGGLLLGVLMTLLIVYGLRQSSEVEQALDARWRRFAERAGLRYRRTRDGRRAQGTIDGRKLRLFTETQQVGNTTVIWTRAAASSQRIPPSLILRAEGAGAGLRRAFTGEDEQTGDDEFDDVARIDGHPADVAALMNCELRRLLRGRLSRGLLTLRTGRLVVSSEPGEANNPNLKGLARACIRLIPALELDPSERAARLARNATQEEWADVRLNCLRMLVEHHPEAPELLPALQAALADPEPAVRLLAATALGHESRAEHARDVAQWLAEGGDIDELVETLGVVGEEGERQDVEWLRPLTRGAFRKRAVKEAAGDAIVQIQTRLGGEQGGLALTDDSEAQGRLSEAESQPQEGALSPAEEDPTDSGSWRRPRRVKA